MKCVICESSELYSSSTIAASYSLDLLPGMSGILTNAWITIIACADCGYLHLFAQPQTRNDIRTSRRWVKRQ